MMSVSRSAFYAWKKSPTTAKEQEDQSLSNLIKIALMKGVEPMVLEGYSRIY